MFIYQLILKVKNSTNFKINKAFNKALLSMRQNGINGLFTY